MMPVAAGRVLTVALLGVLAAIGIRTPAAAGDDWDWGAVEAFDDAPVMRKPVAGASSGPAADAVPRRAAVAEPDYAAQPARALSMFIDVPAFDVIPAKRDSEMHPCGNCHRWVTGNPEPRRLKKPHDNFELQHGLHGHGSFWCFTCHRNDKELGLKTLEGDPVDFADAYVVCSQCHSRQARDWAYGAHGKRVANWQGRRQVLNCTACHYQHRPAFRPREPLPGPTMRVGLPRPAHWVAEAERGLHRESHRSEWQREIDQRREAGGQAQPADTAANSPKGMPDEES